MTDSIQTPTFASLLQRFFIEHLGQQRAVSPRTITAYRDTFRLLLGFAEATIGKAPAVFTLADLDAKLILGFLDHLEKTRNNTVRSRNARLAALRSFLKFAAHHDLTALAVIEQALAVPMKKFDRPMLGFLTRAEMQAVLDAPDPLSWAGRRDRALFSVLYNTGARVSEAIGLRVGDVVTEASPAAHLRGKGRKERSVPLWRPTATLIRGWKKQLGDINDDSFLFPNWSGGKLTRSNVTQRLALAVATATAACPQLTGRTISPHTIRHTTAMHLLQSGVDITVIALWLGHESTTTTHMYLEADLSMKERALEKLQPPGTKAARYRPPDQLMQFLQSLVGDIDHDLDPRQMLRQRTAIALGWLRWPFRGWLSRLDLRLLFAKGLFGVLDALLQRLFAETFRTAAEAVAQQNPEQHLQARDLGLRFEQQVLQQRRIVGQRGLIGGHSGTLNRRCESGRMNLP